MKNAIPISIGAAGLAWYALRPNSKAESKVRPASVANLSAASDVPMPCSTARLESHGVKTLDFLGQFLVQKQSLIAEQGGAFTGTPFEFPLLSAECSAAWCEVWMTQFQKHKTAEDAASVLHQTTGLDVNGLDSVSVTLNFLGLKDDPTKTTAAMAYVALRAEFKLAKASSEPATYSRLRQVLRTTSAMAAALDSNIHVSTDSGLPSNTQLVTDSAKDVGEAIGSGAATVVEKVVAPVVGAGASAVVGFVVSTLAPYLILGGAVYYVAKRK